MQAHEFVSVIRRVVLDSAIESTKSTLANPPGRRPDPRLVELSRWYLTLPVGDRENVDQVLSLAADHSVFGFLCVLDGVRAIDNGKDRGRLELRHVGAEGAILLNDPQGKFLHDLL